MGDNVYLGKRVRDIGRPGLDRESEVRGICRAILRDYRKRRISYRTAMSRLNLLELVIQKSSRIPKYKKRKFRRIVDDYRRKLMT